MTELTQYRISAASAAELVREIEHAVASGALAPGQRLPSVRRLAGEVGLSPATVAAGLAELRRRGGRAGQRRIDARRGSAKVLKQHPRWSRSRFRRGPMTSRAATRTPPCCPT